MATLLVACASPQVVDVRSANQDDRVRFLVLHFTDEDFARSLDLLTNKHANPVSAHYLVGRAGDGGHAHPTVFRLVDESQRAWHAGPSQWQGHTLINDDSIGVEIVYDPHCGERPQGRSPSPWDVDATCAYPDYPSDQIDAVIALAHGILARHPVIEPSRVIGHSDIQPENKTDPGPRFPWKQLAASGIGAWYDDADVAYYRERFGAEGAQLPALKTVQEALAAYGYGIDASGVDDPRTREVLSAFQSHFLPDRRSGSVDVETVATLFALLAKYRAEELRALREHNPRVPESPHATGR